MLNPYRPPRPAETYHGFKHVSALNGTLIGLAIGLLSCDWLDLGPNDFSPLFGWRIGIVICSALGFIIGFARTDRLAWKWFIILGLWHLSIGLTMRFGVFADEPLNVYTLVMPIAGAVFLGSGAGIGLRSFKNGLG